MTLNGCILIKVLSKLIRIVLAQLGILMRPLGKVVVVTQLKSMLLLIVAASSFTYTNCLKNLI